MKTCTIDGCDRAHRAKGYCSSHYSAILDPDRHVVTRACDECGETYTTTRTNGRYCSLLCRDACLHPDAVLHKAVRLAATQRRLEREAERSARPCPAPFPPETRECAWCGVGFTTNKPERVMCSRWCKGKAAKVRRRAREANAPGTYTWCEVTKVYLSLGRQCAYCHTQVNEFEPDHVIPLSKGGSNSITNVVPSCKMCNSDKRDLSLTQWAADRARRGLAVRSLDQRVRHLTSAMLAA